MNLNKLSDAELIELVEESNQPVISSDAKVRAIANEQYGNDLVINILGIQASIALILAERLKLKNKMINELNNSVKCEYIREFTKQYGSSEMATEKAHSFGCGFSKAWDIITEKLKNVN